MKLLSAILLGLMLCTPGFANADDDRRDRRGQSRYAYDDNGRHDGYKHRRQGQKLRHHHGHRWAPPRHYAGQRHYKRYYKYPRRYYRPAYKPVYRYPYRPAYVGAATFSYYDPYSGAISITIPIN